MNLEVDSQGALLVLVVLRLALRARLHRRGQLEDRVETRLHAFEGGLGIEFLLQVLVALV